MATLSIGSFRADFPEFDEAPDMLVQVKLDQAHRAFSEDLFGALYFDAVRYKAAELLARSPFGSSLRIGKSSAETLYSESLADVLSKVPAGPSFVP